MIEGILIKGPLTEEDTKEFADTMRRVEQKRPHETFLLTVLNELGDDVDVTALMNTIFPAIEGQPYDVKKFNRTDQGTIEEQMAKETSAGPTGEYPRGSTGPADQGELRAAVYVRDERLFVNFGKMVGWLAMTKEEATTFANGILQKAEEL